MQHSTAHAAFHFPYDILRNRETKRPHTHYATGICDIRLLLKAKKEIRCNKLDEKLILEYLYLIRF